jgi:hypothetical protein
VKEGVHRRLDHCNEGMDERDRMERDEKFGMLERVGRWVVEEANRTEMHVYKGKQDNKLIYFESTIQN